MNLLSYFAHFCLVSVLHSCFKTSAKVLDGKKDRFAPLKIDLSERRSWERRPELRPLASLLRQRRNAPTGTGTGSSSDADVQISEFSLTDKNHNEAIVHWSGKNSSTMFILTRLRLTNSTVTDSKLWRSDDYGSHFSSVELPSAAKKIIIHYYTVCPQNHKKLVFMDTTNKYLIRSTDEGVSFLNKLDVPIHPDRVIFHPTLEDTFLVYSESERKLVVTSDFGNSWVFVANEVSSRIYWGVPGIDNDISIVHFEALDITTGLSIYKSCTSPYSASQNCKTAKELQSIDVDSFLVANEYMFAQKSSQYFSHFFVSHNRGPFKRAYFPRNTLPVDFTIVDADQHQVFIAANHVVQVVHLYLSDTTGVYYTTSMENVLSVQLSEGGFEADLYEVQGQLGTYIANSYPAVNEGPKTFITYDQGSKWHTLEPPVKYPNGTDISCSKAKSCSLHLHLQYSALVHGFSFILSEINAPGMILAQGTLGTDLEQSKQQPDLFMSSDGGITWKMLKEGNFGFSILDQGGAFVIVKLDHNRNSNEIFYSCDEGQTFQKHNFKEKKIRVDGILNEPGITTTVVSIFGHDASSAGWTVIKVDFSKVLKRQCTDDDFTEWKPLDHLQEKRCLLGQKLTYKRRKPDAKCLIGAKYENSVVSTPCVCNEEDYECDYGFISDKNEKCVAEDWRNPDLPVGECPEGEKYMKTKGYRKIASDKCENGSIADYAPVATACPLTAPLILIISLEGRYSPAVESRKNVSFELMQARGSKKSTTYVWNFGDGSKNVTFAGFDNASPVKHIFTKRGKYTVTVTATNAKGNTTGSTHIIVEDRLNGMFVDIPRGAYIDHETVFEADLFTSSLALPETTKHGHVHYLWTFGDEEVDEHPLLSWDRLVRHTYKKHGNYSGQVEAINNVGSIFRTFTVDVYSTMRVYSLTFDTTTDRIKQDTVFGRQIFNLVVTNTLCELLNVDFRRLEVGLVSGFATVAEVSIIPLSTDITDDSSIGKIASDLESLFDKGLLMVNLSKNDFGIDYTSKVVALRDITDEGSSASKGNYVAVYVCVPLLIVAIFISFLVVIYYKRMIVSRHRYSILHSRSQGADDALLDVSDDDDPPLDPNPDLTNQRLALDDDDLADDPLGAHLMMGSTNRRPVNC